MQAQALSQHSILYPYDTGRLLAARSAVHGDVVGDPLGQGCLGPILDGWLYYLDQVTVLESLGAV